MIRSPLYLPMHRGSARSVHCSSAEADTPSESSAAGGWSQQRYARRRQNQTAKAYAAAADVASTVLLPAVDELAAVFLGGDRTAVTTVLADPRLVTVQAKSSPDVLAVADPRLAVLRAFPDQFLAIRIHLNHLA